MFNFIDGESSLKMCDYGFDLDYRDGDSLEGNIEEDCDELKDKIQALIARTEDLEQQNSEDEKHALIAEMNLSLQERWEELEDAREEAAHDILNLQDDIYSLLGEIDDYERKWLDLGLEAIAFDFDDQIRYGHVVDCQYNKVEDKRFRDVEELKKKTKAFKKQVDEQEIVVLLLADRFDEFCRMRVYRLLRPDEDSSEGFYRRQGYDDTVPVSDHIAKGSYLPRGSRFISTSKNFEVCLFYASKAHYRWNCPIEDLKIAAIDLDLNWGDVYDLTDKFLRRDIGIVEGSTADNYARKLDEVLVERTIFPEEIVSVSTVTEDLPNEQHFNEFKMRLRQQGYANVR